MCGQRLRAGLLLLVVFLWLLPASSWADVVLTDEEWEELKTQVQILMNENEQLKETLKIAREESERSLSLQAEQLRILEAQLTESMKLSEKWKSASEFWKIIGLVGIGGAAMGGLYIWLH